LLAGWESLNSANTAYVKLRNAVTCGDSRATLNVQLAARLVPVMHHILHSYAPRSGLRCQARALAACYGTCHPALGFGHHRHHGDPPWAGPEPGHRCGSRRGGPDAAGRWEVPEHGGNAPFIIFDDADIDAAVEGR
jgi:hypothetical protein